MKKSDAPEPMVPQTLPREFSRGVTISSLILLLTLLAGSGWFFNAQKQLQRQSIEATLQSIAQLKAGQIAEWRNERLADAAVLASRNALTDSVQRYLSNPTALEISEIKRRFCPVMNRYHFADVFIVNMQKEVKFAMISEAEPCPEHVSAVDAAFAAHHPVWTALHTAAKRAFPHISLVTPLFSQKEENTPVGAVILVTDASQFLYPLIQSWPIPSKTAETLLVRKDGEDVLFLNELRHKKGTALTYRIPLSRIDLPAAMAIKGIKGIVQGRDYRGIDVIAAILPVPDSPWFMISKMDATEAFAEWRFRSVMMGLLFLGALALMAAGAFIFRQRNLKVHYRALYESEAALSQALNQHRITLKAIGDAVISTDAEGRVNLMNPVAETLTGWRQAEAHGRKLQEVFPIVNEKTRKPVKDPVAKILKEGRVMGLTNHTLLIARDGREIPITDSGSLIRDEKKHIIGVVLVFKDQSRERQYQNTLLEREKKYKLILQTAMDGFWLTDLHGNIREVNDAYCQMSGYSQKELLSMHISALEEKMRPDEIAAAIEKTFDRKQYRFDTMHRRKDGSLFNVEISVQYLPTRSGNLVIFLRDITSLKKTEQEKELLQAQLLQAQKMESVGRLAGGVAHDFNNMLGVILGYGELALEETEALPTVYTALQEIMNAARRSVDITRQLLAFARKQTISPEVLDINNTIEDMIKMLKRLIGEDIDLAWLPGEFVWPVKMDPAQIDQILVNLCVNARDAIEDIGKITIETGTAEFDESYCRNHLGFIPGEYVFLAVSDNGCGISPKNLDAIFEPFFTTKKSGAGTGLGLSMIYGIVKQNNGFINVYSELDHGTTFRIYFSRHRNKEDLFVKNKTANLSQRGNETILLVEDEPAIMKMTEMMLKRLGYTVIAAGTPGDAIQFAQNHDKKIDLLMTDVVMPEMNGHDLSKNILTIHPNIKTLFMSGYTANVIAHHGVLDEGIHFIPKPFSVEQLGTNVRKALS